MKSLFLYLEGVSIDPESQLSELGRIRTYRSDAYHGYHLSCLTPIYSGGARHGFICLFDGSLSSLNMTYPASVSALL